MSQFVGRRAELTALANLVVEHGALIVRGEAGAGKTALVERLIADEGIEPVFRTGGVEGLFDIPWAALAELVRPIEVEMRTTEELQPLAAVVGVRRADREPSALEVEAALLAAMRDRPGALWFVDDAQWLDGETARLVGRVARQAHAIGASILITSRPGAFDGFGLPELRLEGLDEADARRLVASRHGLLPADAVQWAIDVSGGNPLGLVELPLEYLRDANSSKAAGAVSERLLNSFGGQITKLGDAAELAVIAAALGDPVDGDVLIDVLERLGLDADALSAAERHDLVVVADGRIRFRHPLVRHAADRSATTAVRRKVLATWAETTRSTERALRYRAGATTPPDDALADAFEQVATIARVRAAFASEWRLRREAARFTADPTRRARQLLAAAAAAERSGDREQADQLLTDAIDVDPRLVDDPEHVLVRFRLSTARGDIHEVLGLAERAITRAGTVPPAIAIQGLRLALFQRMMLGRPDDALELATAAFELAGDDLAAVFLADEAAAMALTQAGRLDEARFHARRAVTAVDAGVGDPERIVTLGLVLTWLEMYEDASRLLSGEIARHRREGNARALAGALANLADRCLRTGDLTTAHSLATESVAVADALGDRSMLVDMLATAAHVAALTGDPSAEAMLQRASGLVVTSSSKLWIGAAQAQLLLLQGDAQGALATLDSLGDLEPQSFREPNELRLFALRLQALVVTGDKARADACRHALQLVVERGTTRWSTATFHRFAGLAAHDVDRADASFALALAALQPEDGPIEPGVVLLDQGRYRRRAGQRTAARDSFEQAHRLFERAGATPFAVAAANEIGATAPRLRPRTPGSGDALTERERAVAELAATGATDKEIAASLFVSPKTVSFHLANVFRKLGLTGRNELHGALSSSSPAPDTHEASGC